MTTSIHSPEKLIVSRVERRLYYLLNNLVWLPSLISIRRLTCFKFTTRNTFSDSTISPSFKSIDIYAIWIQHPGFSYFYYPWATCMCIDCAVDEFYPVSIYCSSAIVEFAYKFALLNDEKRDQCCLPIPTPIIHTFVPLLLFLSLVSFLPNMATFLEDPILCFSGRNVINERRQKDLTTFIKNLNFAINGQTYTDENRKLIVTQIIFWTHLRDESFSWYHAQNANTQAKEQMLEVASFSWFVLIPQKEVD